MSKSNVIVQLRDKSTDKQKLAARVAKRPEMVPELIDGLGSSEASVKFGSSKVLIITSEQHPAVLYPHIEQLFKLLDSDNNIIQWGAIQMIGNLSDVDTQGKINRRLNKYLKPISGPVLITATNVIQGAAKIAKAKPGLSKKITPAIIGVEKANYKTAECRNIAIGKAIEAFDLCFDNLADQQPVLRFVRRQTKNSRPATKKKAERFLKKRD